MANPARSRILLTVLGLVFLALTQAARLPGHRVYVVTPASHVQIDSPKRNVQYWSWRRSDDVTTTPVPNTHDLIFADFESEANSAKKSVRKLLERERVSSTTTTTTTPSPDLIFAEFESGLHRDKSIRNLLQKEKVTAKPQQILAPPISDENKDDDDIHQPIYHKAYDIEYSYPKLPMKDSPEYSTEEEETETTIAPIKVEDIWHVIDKEREHETDDETGWKEVPLNDDHGHKIYHHDDAQTTTTTTTTEDPYKNFVFPGFGHDVDKPTENESRAIRTESNIRFPYVNLKTYQMKTKPHTSSNKKNNVYTSLDSLQELTQPVRGEVRDRAPVHGPIDRYNPAQPYLPPSPYGSKPSPPASAVFKPPTKVVANLIPPPPPPPPPPAAAGDFLAPPDNYESFPPYAPAPQPPTPPAPAPRRPVTSAFRPTLPPPPEDDSDSGPPPDDPGPSDEGYVYKPPSSGYSYKAPNSYKAPSPGYSYKPPEPLMIPQSPGYSYDPPMQDGSHPTDDDSGSSDDTSGPSALEPPVHKPSYPGYSYTKPHNIPEEMDYPELIYNKPAPAMMGGDLGTMVKGVEMKPPPPPPPPPPAADDHKPDFPNLTFDDHYKYHDDDDFDHYHHYPHHHHPTTTTTTTTEMPRVNRFSYYYLGKKLYYLPLYFSVYFVIYVAALIIKAVLRHKIVYPNSWRNPGRSARDADSYTSPERLHEITATVTNALMRAAAKYTSKQD